MKLLEKKSVDLVIKQID